MREVLELFPVLEQSLSRRAGSLSGGQQQQLSVARALMSRPRMLLMDEPSAGLARNSLAPNIVRLVETNRQLHVRGMTILLVEQNGGVAAAVAEIAYVLRFGVIAHSGPAAELISNAELLASYLGR